MARLTAENFDSSTEPSVAKVNLRGCFLSEKQQLIENDSTKAALKLPLLIKDLVLPFDLNQNFQPAEDPDHNLVVPLDPVLASVRPIWTSDPPLPSHHPVIISYRNNIRKLMEAPYSINPWKIGVQLTEDSSALLLHISHEIDFHSNSIRDQKFQHYGFFFENVITGRTAEYVQGQKGTDFCTIIDCSIYHPSYIPRDSSAPLAEPPRHRIFLAAETDGHQGPEITEDIGDLNQVFDHLKTNMVELKTCQMIHDIRSLVNFVQFKCRNYWIQSYIAAVPFVVIGFHEEGRLCHIKTIPTNVLPQLQDWQPKDVAMFLFNSVPFPLRPFKFQRWQPSVCVSFLSRALTLLKQNVRPGQKKILSFNGKIGSRTISLSDPETSVDHSLFLESPSFP